MGDAELVWSWGLKGCQRAVGISQVLQGCREERYFGEKGLRSSRRGIRGV